MSTKIYYLDCEKKEKEAYINELPQTCGDCPFYSSRETYSHYDDLEGFDVSYEKIICKANEKVLKNVRKEGSWGFDYGEKDRTLEKRAQECPLYRK